MERLTLFTLLIKVLLYFALIIVLLGDIYQPLGPTARIILASLALIEAIGIIRKVDNRKGSNKH
ncbi:hypothetical protein GCM10011351_07130 [Paraliobacillus quinghaiensis]|uniref:Uncharacterized protein n=1 Tax=Paraliobacillus quinghaiensis TaxID=470815 RepID=A0A917TIB3_9BACI|nr:hypothetical protein [Paraliobacillus quinghaiensis]GGM23915.1 hypothetical protein GCM10011351_07130 [Paraliobacillus quinghaiensis]